MRGHGARVAGIIAVCLAVMAAVSSGVAGAGQGAPAGTPTAPTPAAPSPSAAGPTAAPEAAIPRETVEADISTRWVAVTAGYSGTEIIIFGAVDHSRQRSPDEGLYDIVVSVEGVRGPLVVRQKSPFAGIWVNAQSMKFQNVPSFYAIATTRPLAEVTDDKTRSSLAIGFDHIAMTPRRPQRFTEAEVNAYRNAVIRLKQRDGLYVSEDYGVSFTGRGLFRTTIALPANVPVGPLAARICLFRDGQLLSQYTAQVRLEREGIERILHTFAFDFPVIYGLATVLFAVAAGLTASSLFGRRS